MKGRRLLKFPFSSNRRKKRGGNVGGGSVRKKGEDNGIPLS